MGGFYVTSEARAGCARELAYCDASMAPSSSEVQRTVMGPPWASSSTVLHGLKTEPSLNGATLMTHAKFEVIAAKLIMRTREVERMAVRATIKGSSWRGNRSELLGAIRPVFDDKEAGVFCGRTFSPPLCVGASLIWSFVP